MAAEKYEEEAIGTLANAFLDALGMNVFKLDTTVFDNTHSTGTSTLDGRTHAQLELTLAAVGTAFLGVSVLELWLLRSIDGTNYESGDVTGPRPIRAPDALFFIDAVASAQRILGVRGATTDRDNWAIPLPPGKFKLLVRLTNATGGPTALAGSSGNFIKVRAFSLQNI
jgi:hypothetical protein